VNAQRTSTQPPASVTSARDFEIEASRLNASPISSSERGGGSVFFYEDFSNGFAGSNGYGPMTFWDSADNSIWMMATSESPAGEFSSNLAAMNSPTASNGWVIFDCDLYNTPILSGVEDVTGALVTPVMDCSNRSSVIVEYHQYFRYCCFPMSPLTLEVSTDGGQNWVVYPGHGSFFPSANTLSANSLLTRVDVSCAAAGQSNVQIRWGYDLDNVGGYSHYFWGIDDITIYENPVQHDLEVVQTLNGDVWNDWEFRAIPFEQRVLSVNGGLLAGVVYRNNGFTNENNTIVQVQILDDAENVLFSVESDPFLMESFANTPECPSYLLDTLYIPTGWVPTAIGKYIVRATINSDNIDEFPNNNTKDRVVEYTTCEYGHEDNQALTAEVRPRTAESNSSQFDPTGYGSFFTFPNNGSIAHGISVAFGNNTDVGVDFNAVLYRTNGSLNQSGEIVSSQEYIVTEGQLNGAYHYYPYDAPHSVSNSQVYFAAVLNDVQSPLELTVRAQPNSDSDNSTAVFERGGSGNFVWFQSQTWSPAVRLILCSQVGIEEIVQDELLSRFMISPNPAYDIARITYELNSSAAIAYEVRDRMGRLVEYSNLGRMQPGLNTLNLNVSNYANGIYTVGLVVDNQRMFSKQLSVVH
jgi:hypothetical protein